MLRTAALILILITVGAAPASKEPASPGLVLRFQSGASSDVRSTRLAALYVPENTPPTPFLAAGPYRATLEGDLNLRLREQLAFSLAGRGSVKLLINGQVVLAKSGEDLGGASPFIQLNKGKNRLVLEYEPPAKGDGWVRLYWQGSDFPAEPIPPEVFTHSLTEPVNQATLLREGRELIATLRCLNCHDGPQAASAIASARTAAKAEFSPALLHSLPMPELAMDAPDLTDVGGRLNESWMAHWINDPRSLRPDASMPRLVGDAAAARNIAAYLATLGAKPAGEEPAPDDQVIETGGRLFAHLRCIGCHTLPERAEPDQEHNRVPLAYIKAKYKPAALRAFLKSPQKHYAWIRMPDFKISDGEAQSLAAFLLSRQQKALELPQEPKPDPAAGRQLLISSGCLNCHVVEKGTDSSLKAPTWVGLKDDAWARGCMADTPPPNAPRFQLREGQRAAIKAFARTDLSSLNRETLPELVSRQFRTLNCIACHTRDGDQDIYSQVEDEVADFKGPDIPEQVGEGEDRVSPDQSEPVLTWAGEKLKPQWTAQLLHGRINERLRPWLRPRMPAFPAKATLLAHGLPLEHGFPPVAPNDQKPDPTLVEIGRKLVGKEGGFACISCHGAGPMKPVGVFEAPGINLQYSAERLNPHYYTRWVYSPLRMQKDTKMLSFADLEGKTSLPDLGGDARRQYEAIRHYLLTGRRMQPPSN